MSWFRKRRQAQRDPNEVTRADPGIQHAPPPEEPEPVVKQTWYLDEVQRLVDKGKIVNAIKLYRANTQTSLTEAKAYVDRLRRDL